MISFSKTYKTVGKPRTVETLDRLKETGFKIATRAGVSIGIDDMIIPEAKPGIVKDARKRIDEVEGQYKKGIITEGERYNKIIDIWTGTTDDDRSGGIRRAEEQRRQGHG